MEFYSHIKPYLELVERSMQETLGREDPRVYGMIGPFLKLGGKRIRPVLCLLSCGALGGRYEHALEPAAILELFHNFTLIHDDIEDNSQYRRGEPTLHIKYGIPIALNSGDALYTLLWKKIVNLKAEPSRLAALQKLYASGFKRVVDGQGIELSWIYNQKFDVSEKDYFDMIGGKTSALLGVSSAAGALMAGAGKDDLGTMERYGEKLGTAFQIHDDVLNLTGSFESYKKEIGGDIIEGKRTLMAVHCMKNCDGREKKKLTSILGTPPESYVNQKEQKEHIDAAIELMKKYGSISYAANVSKTLVAEAKEELSSLPSSKDKDALMKLADYVVDRQR